MLPRSRRHGLEEEVRGALERSRRHLAGLQSPRGDWAGEVVWNTVPLSQWVIVGHLVGHPFSGAEREGALRYWSRWRTAEGAFGLHPEAGPSLFATALAYVAMRLLGVPREEPLAADALRWVRGQGGVLRIPTWGKFWLALLGLYGWEGVTPIPPEAWLLPDASPVHPAHLYCHTRLIYLAMGYLYGRRLVAPPHPILGMLQDELYEGTYGKIDFRRWRHEVAPTDLLESPPPGTRRALEVFERAVHLPGADRLRQQALRACLDQVRFEENSTGSACCSPVNGLLNVLVLWDHEPEGDEWRRAWRGVDYWRFEDDREGLRFAGAHSHTWDTSFVVQGLSEMPEPREAVRPLLARALGYLRQAQMGDEIPEDDRKRFYRDRLLGGYCFSDEVHRWPVSDCTAEALSAVLAARLLVPDAEGPEDAMLIEAVRFLLSRQNDDGGFGSYERRRGPKWLGRINITEMFGACMTEGSYVECTGSCVAALARFRRRFPRVLAEEVSRAIDRGRDFLLGSQHPDGGWEGFWGVGFAYGTFFAVEGLVEAGLPPSHPSLTRACAFLRTLQGPDGGIGEHWTTCTTRRRQPGPPTAAQTAWALLAWLRAGQVGEEAVERALGFLLSRQLPDGGFPVESVTGVFFHSSMLHYRLYRDVFPMWAMARYLAHRASG